MTKRKILFVCIHNSARSQMAAAFLNETGKDFFSAQSAGLEPGILNPYVVAGMAEAGIDISDSQTKAVSALLGSKDPFDAVITVCDAASSARCPVFPGRTKRIAWFFPDPSGFKGTKEEILEQTRKVRDLIRAQVIQFVKQAADTKFWA
jgi:arsenate reductase